LSIDDLYEVTYAASNGHIRQRSAVRMTSY